MKKTISIFKLVQDSTKLEYSFSTTKQAEEAKQVLAVFGVEVELVKEKKVIEL